MKRILKPFLIVFILAAVGLAAWWFLKVKENRSPNPLTLYGNIDIRDAQLAFIEPERIAQVLVEEGDRVTKGEVLARLHTDRIQTQIRESQAQVAAQQQVVNELVAGTRPQEIAQARAQVALVRVQVKNATQNLERIRKTVRSGASSRQALDDASARLDVAQAQLRVQEKALSLAVEGPRKQDIAAAKDRLEALKASLEFLKIRLQDMTLKAPAAGVIENRILEPGDMAGPNSPVFTLALTDPKWVRAYVSEPDLGRVHLGMKAIIHSDSFPDQRFSGWVGFISPVAEFTPKNVETTDLRTKLVYEVRIFVHDPKDQLRLGMPNTVTFQRTAGTSPPGENAPSKPASKTSGS